MPPLTAGSRPLLERMGHAPTRALTWASGHLGSANSQTARNRQQREPATSCVGAASATRASVAVSRLTLPHQNFTGRALCDTCAVATGRKMSIYRWSARKWFRLCKFRRLPRWRFIASGWHGSAVGLSGPRGNDRSVGLGIGCGNLEDEGHDRIDPLGSQPARRGAALALRA